MALDVAALLTCMILEKAPRSIESIVQRDVDIHVRFLLGVCAAHVDLTARHGQIDLDVERCTFVAMGRRCFDDYVATGNAAVKSL